MAPIKIECTSCHKKYNVDEKLLGRKVTCSNQECGVQFIALAVESSHVTQARSGIPAEKAPTSTSHPNRQPPPLRTKLESTQPTQEATAVVTKTDVEKTKHYPTFVLYALAVVPSVLLLAILLLYWRDVSSRQGANVQPGAKESRGVQGTPDSDSTTETTELETEAFQKNTVRFLAAMYSAVNLLERDVKLNITMPLSSAEEDNILLREIRSRIPIPPPGIKNRKDIQQEFDSILEVHDRAAKLMKRPKKPVHLTNFSQIIDALRRVNQGTLTNEQEQAFGNVTKAANKIAEELGIGFDEAHKSNHFHQSSVELITIVREHAKNFKDTLSFPTRESPIESIFLKFDLVDITGRWGLLREPPALMNDRKNRLLSLEKMVVSMIVAHDSRRHAYNARNFLSEDEFLQLRLLHEDALEEALKIADEIEPLFNIK